MWPNNAFLKFVLVCLAGSNHVTGFASKTLSRSRFATSKRSCVLCKGAVLAMDTEVDSLDKITQEQISRTLFGVSPSMRSLSLPRNTPMAISVQESQQKYGMPWVESIDGVSPLLYMKFWTWQLSFMEENLTNLKVVQCDESFAYNENMEKGARIVSLCFKSNEYRKIRMTYYDAGENCQVFNSLWYPDERYNLPVLGIDLLAFNRKKHLAVVDFQPIHKEENMHAAQYEKTIGSIRRSYNALKGKMSSRFYDETQFFSRELLFARFEEEKVVGEELFPAFQRYVDAHVDMVKGCAGDESAASCGAVLERQAAYDTYSAERDPAIGLFTAMFGKEWAEGFVHDFLFSLSSQGKSVAEKLENPSKEQTKVSRKEPLVCSAK